MEHNFRVVNNTITLRDGSIFSGKNKLYKTYEIRYPLKQTISSGDWINTFMEPLGFGKIIVFEIITKNHQIQLSLELRIEYSYSLYTTCPPTY